MDLRTLCNRAEERAKALVQELVEMQKSLQYMQDQMGKKQNEVIAAQAAYSALRIALGEPIIAGSLPNSFADLGVDTSPKTLPSTLAPKSPLTAEAKEAEAKKAVYIKAVPRPDRQPIEEE